MQLNHNGRAMGLVMLLVGGLHLTACSGDETTPDGGVTIKNPLVKVQLIDQARASARLDGNPKT